jgi:hypothetical protein
VLDEDRIDLGVLQLGLVWQELDIQLEGARLVSLSVPQGQLLNKHFGCFGNVSTDYNPSWRANLTMRQ